MEDLSGMFESLSIHQRYNDILQKADALQKDSEIPDHAVVFKDDLEYKLMDESNALLENIEKKIRVVSDFIHHNYGPHYLRLYSLVEGDPIIYAHVAKKIGNEMDLTLVDLKELLPPATKNCRLTLADRVLPEDVLQKTLEACDCVIELDLARKKLIGFVESAMVPIAPNLSAIVGSAVAAKLMVSAGGLAALANMSVSDIQLLGVKEKILNGASPFVRVGYIMDSELLQTTVTPDKLLACRLLAETSIRAARIDSIRVDPTGKCGRSFLEEIRKQLPYKINLTCIHYPINPSRDIEDDKYIPQSLLDMHGQRWYDDLALPENVKIPKNSEGKTSYIAFAFQG